MLASVFAVLAAGCGGGGSTVGSAESLTKKAMKSHDTKYTSIECVQPSSSKFVCEALGSGATPGLYAWCSVPLNGDTIGEFDAAFDCHWPEVKTAPKTTSPNNPVLTTPSRLGK